MTALIIAIVIFLLIGKVMGWFKFGEEKTTAVTQEEVTEKVMIDVMGIAEDAAKTLLDKEGFTAYEIVHELNIDVQEGYVFEQSIKAGEIIPVDEPIKIKVSSGAEEIDVPDVKGLSDKQAKILLEDAGFKVVHSFEFSDSVEKDIIISQSPEGGAKAPAGSTVNIVVSNGNEIKLTTVPNITNIPESEAIKALYDAKLAPGNVTKENSDTIPQGSVIRQTVAANSEAEEGTKIDYVVSEGPAVVVKTYKASFSGNINNISYDFANGPVRVEVIYKLGNASYTVLSTSGLDAADKFPFDLSGSDEVTNLSGNTGSATFKVYDSNGADITNQFTGAVSVNHQEESN